MDEKSISNIVRRMNEPFNTHEGRGKNGHCNGSIRHFLHCEKPFMIESDLPIGRPKNNIKSKLRVGSIVESAERFALLSPSSAVPSRAVDPSKIHLSRTDMMIKVALREPCLLSHLLPIIRDEKDGRLNIVLPREWQTRIDSHPRVREREREDRTASRFSLIRTLPYLQTRLASRLVFIACVL